MEEEQVIAHTEGGGPVAAPSAVTSDQAGEEAQALSYLAEWINIQGDEGEVRAMQERAEAQIPSHVESGS